MFGSCGRFRFGVRIIYGTAVFIPQLPCGSFRCGKNCATCSYILDGLTSYTFFSTGETRTIKSDLTCDTRNLIYMIQCNRCN